MVLAAVDDLLFSSKIRATAKAAGVDVTFARSRSEVLEQARLLQPALIVFDLNSAKIEPIHAIAALKADPALARLRTLGFVSHVDTSVINAARAAGADEVLARSAFAGQLADILRAADGTASR
jgi:CheY-like chemotaxis protein